MKNIVLMSVMVAAAGAAAMLDFSGVEGLAMRVGGEELSAKVRFVEYAAESGDKAVIVPDEPAPGEFTIKATTVRAASLALGVYVRDVAGGHVSWCGSRLPKTWPVPKEELTVEPRYPMAMAYNYCTLSYTMAYWSVEAWREEIDRLALAGYNTALLMAGVQKTWSTVMDRLGYTQQQKDDFITDDAQQAWWLMGNLQNFGNETAAGHFPVVTAEEIEKDAEIGRELVKMMREVGIEPVFQSFVGLVPSTTSVEQLKANENFAGLADGDIRIIKTGYYCEGCKNPDLIDPTSKAFKVFSDAWNDALKAVYALKSEPNAGEYDYYPKYLGGDLFHESTPPRTMDYEDQVNCARYVQQYQTNAFGRVKWVLQNWQTAPAQTIRNGLDPELTIIQKLDQGMNGTGPSNGSYVNRYDPKNEKRIPWVWAEVMNFGGNTGMHGAFRRFRNVGNLGEGGERFEGYAMLSEGLETNPVSYDMYHWAMAQKNKESQNITEDELEPWLAAYRARRYGLAEDDEDLKAAHSICARTVWNCSRNQQGAVESVFCASPAWRIASVSAWGPAAVLSYDRAELVSAARHYLAAAKRNEKLMELETFRYDFVEIFQQILADKARETLPLAEGAQTERDRFRRMLDLTDRILACSDLWRLDRKEARLKGKAPKTGPAAYRRLITTWMPGRRHQTQLAQYAHRSYAGLVAGYYAKKWNAFFDVCEGKMTPEEYRDLCDRLDEEFPTMTLKPEPTDGDPVAIAEEILAEVDPAAGGGTPVLSALVGTRTPIARFGDPLPVRRYRVTVPGAVSVNLEGVDYEKFEDALAAAKASQAATPGQEVRLWVTLQEVFDDAQAEVDAYNAAHSTSYTFFGNGDGIRIIGWNATE